MTRKMVLLVGTFLAAFLLFSAWQLIAPHSGAGGDWFGPPKSTSPRAKQAMVLERRDKFGRRVQRLELPRWKKNDKTGAFDCEDPAGVVYGSGAQRVYVRADKGTIYAEGVSGEIRHAT
ncbi:MAG: hypothetical protein NTV86_18290 [Planctomycetota bacterium]|nr:hypothetical protein [Planctomycetota bacterium]